LRCETLREIVGIRSRPKFFELLLGRVRAPLWKSVTASPITLNRRVKLTLYLVAVFEAIAVGVGVEWIGFPLTFFILRESIPVTVELGVSFFLEGVISIPDLFPVRVSIAIGVRILRVRGVERLRGIWKAVAVGVGKSRPALRARERGAPNLSLR
jgi:hypothetical protein